MERLSEMFLFDEEGRSGLLGLLGRCRKQVCDWLEFVCIQCDNRCQRQCMHHCVSSSSLHRLVYDLLLHQANSVLILSFLGLQLQFPLPKLFLLAFEVFLLGPELSLQFLKTSLILIDHFEFNLSDVVAFLLQVLAFALQAVENCLFPIFELVQSALVLLLHLTHPEQILILVLLLYFILQIHLQFTFVLLLFGVQLHAQLLLVLVERLRHLFNARTRNQLPVIDLCLVLTVNLLQLFTQRLAEVRLSCTLLCPLTANSAKLFNQSVKVGLSVCKFAQIGYFRKLIESQTILFLQTALGHEDRQRIFQLAHRHILSNYRLQKLATQVKRGILLRCLIRYDRWSRLFQFLEQVCSQGSFELGEETGFLEVVIKLLAKEHRVGRFSHLIQKQ